MSKAFLAQCKFFFSENSISVWNEKNAYHTIPIYENCMISNFFIIDKVYRNLLKRFVKKLYMCQKRFLLNVSFFFIENSNSIWNEKNTYHAIWKL